MVQYCVAYGCKNLHDTSRKIPFHTFPFKRPQILELWIKAVRRDNWNPAKTSRLCGLHFTESDYKIVSGGILKLLKPDAVPSIFNFPKPMTIKNTTPRILKRAHEEESSNCILQEVEVDSNMSTQQTKKFKNVGMQTNISGEQETYIMLRKMKVLKEKVKRRDLKLRNMKDVINELSKNSLSNKK